MDGVPYWWEVHAQSLIDRHHLGLNAEQTLATS